MNTSSDYLMVEPDYRQKYIESSKISEGQKSTIQSLQNQIDTLEEKLRLEKRLILPVQSENKNLRDLLKLYLNGGTDIALELEHTIENKTSTIEELKRALTERDITINKLNSNVSRLISEYGVTGEIVEADDCIKLSTLSKKIAKGFRINMYNMSTDRKDLFITNCLSRFGKDNLILEDDTLFLIDNSSNKVDSEIICSKPINKEERLIDFTSVIKEIEDSILEDE